MAACFNRLPAPPPLTDGDRLSRSDYQMAAGIGQVLRELKMEIYPTQEELEAMVADCTTNSDHAIRVFDCKAFARRIIDWHDKQLRKQEPVARLPFAILDEEIADLRRFTECADDGEGYDVPKDRMKRLAEIGMLRHVSAGYYEHTVFGLSVLNGDFAAPVPAPAVLQRWIELCEKGHGTTVAEEIRALLSAPPSNSVVKDSLTTAPSDALLRSRVADLLHLLQFAEIATPSPFDAVYAENAMDDIRAMLSAAPQAPVINQQAPSKDQKDAERYRWLRQHYVDTQHHKQLPFPQSHIMGEPCMVTVRIGGSGDELDAAVDAAMKGGE